MVDPCGGIGPLLEGDEDDQDHADPDGQMDRVDAGHDPVKAPEDLGGGRRQRKAWSGEKVLFEIYSVLQPFARRNASPSAP